MVGSTSRRLHPPHGSGGGGGGALRPPWDAHRAPTIDFRGEAGGLYGVEAIVRPRAFLCVLWGSMQDSPRSVGWQSPDPLISLHKCPVSEDGGWCVSPYCLGAGLRPRASLCVYLGSEPKLSLRNLIRLARASEETYSPCHSLMYHLATSPAT